MSLLPPPLDPLMLYVCLQFHRHWRIWGRVGAPSSGKSWIRHWQVLFSGGSRGRQLSRGGGGRQHTILPNVPKICMKLKEFGPGRYVPGAPLPLDPLMLYVCLQFHRCFCSCLLNHNHKFLRRFICCRHLWQDIYKYIFNGAQIHFLT